MKIPAAALKAESSAVCDQCRPCLSMGTYWIASKNVLSPFQILSEEAAIMALENFIANGQVELAVIKIYDCRL